MSATLKGNILSTGNLEELIFNAINFFGCAEGYIGPIDPCEAQRLFAQRLATAISQGIAVGVQQYLTESVKTINQRTLFNEDGGVQPHIHPNVAQYDLEAP